MGFGVCVCVCVFGLGWVGLGWVGVGGGFVCPCECLYSRSKHGNLLKPKELEGYLKKLGEKGPRKTWKKRWFLQRGSRIYYYERQTDVVEKGFVNLEEALSVVPSSDGKKSFAFQVLFLSGRQRWLLKLTEVQIHTPRRIYFLQAETEEAMKYWINGVKKSLQNLQKKEEEEERGGTRLSMRLNTAKNRVVATEGSQLY